MFHGNKYIAAGLAAGLAISALATPSFAQRAEDNNKQYERQPGEGDARLQRRSRENAPVHLGRPAAPQKALLHDAAGEKE